jgi:hypothetical protein
MERKPDGESLSFSPAIEQAVEALAHASEHLTKLRGEQNAAPLAGAAALRAHQRARAARKKVFGRGLFSDPGWDVLLEVYACDLEGRKVSISGAIAAVEALTTGRRHLEDLEQRGFLERADDPNDRRRSWLALTVRGRELMAAYCAENPAAWPGAGTR